MAFNRNFAFTILINARAQTRELDAAVNQLKNFQDKVRFVEKAIFRFNTLAFAARRLLIGGAALSGAFVVTTKAAGDLEAQMLEVAKTTELSGRDVDQLTGQMLRLSTVLPSTAEQLSDIALTAGQMGLVVGKSGQEAVDILTEFTSVVSKAALATSLGQEDAAIAAGRLNRILGLQVHQAENLLSAINDLENQTLALSSEIVNIALRFGPFASQVGVSAEQVLGLAAAMREFGLQSQVAGTNLTIILARMQKDFPKFARVAGLSAGQFGDMIREDPVEALLLFSESLAKLSGDNIAFTKALDRVGLSGGRVVRVMTALAGNVDRTREILGLSNEAFAEGTSIQREFERRMEGLNAQFQVLVNSVRSLATRMGQTLIPAAKFIVQTFSVFLDILNLIPKPILFLVAAAGILAGGLLIVVGGLITLVSAVGFAVTSIIFAVDSFKDFVSIWESARAGLSAFGSNLLRQATGLTALARATLKGNAALAQLIKEELSLASATSVANASMSRQVAIMAGFGATTTKTFTESGAAVSFAAGRLRGLRSGVDNLVFAADRVGNSFKLASVFPPQLNAQFQALQTSSALAGARVSKAAGALKVLRAQMGAGVVATGAATSVIQKFGKAVFSVFTAQLKVLKSLGVALVDTTKNIIDMIRQSERLQAVLSAIRTRADKLIPTFTKAFDVTVGKVGDLGSSLFGVIKDTDRLKAGFGAVQGQVSKFLPTFGRFFRFAGRGFAKIGKSAASFTSPLIDLAKTGLGKLSAALGPLTAALGSAAGPLGAFFTAIGGPAIAAIAAALGAVAAIVISIKDNFLGLGDLFNEVKEAIRGIMEAVVSGFGLASEEGRGFFDLFKTFLKIVFSPTLVALKAVFAIIIPILKALKPVFFLIGGIMALISGAFELLLPVFEFIGFIIDKLISFLLIPIRLFSELGKMISSFQERGFFGGLAFTLFGAAEGAVVQPTPGGTPLRVAEGGEAEVIAPLSKLPEVAQSVRPSPAGGGIANLVAIFQIDGREVARGIAPFTMEEIQLSMLDGRPITRRGTGG